MRSFTDEQLAACVDGELPAADAGAINEAARTDPELARRLRRFADTRRVLQQAFAATLEQPLPARLLETLDAAPAAPVRWRPRWQPLALAASLLAGIGVAVLTLRTATPPPTMAGLPTDAMALATVLERAPSGMPVELTEGSVRYAVMPLASVQTAARQYCREFESANASGSVRAAACRQPAGGWTVIAAASYPIAAPTGSVDAQPYRRAGAAAPAPLTALGEVRRLTPHEEGALLASGWAAP